jgi:regulator of protease activity HflC (stomatin/prohibitin superfamily)
MVDRILGAFCAFVVLLSAIAVFSEFSWSWSWALLVLWTVGLGIWVRRGIRKIEVGWRGQILFLGQRMAAEVGEGWRWIPFPFGLKTADCRETVMKLDQLKIFTSDSVEVKVDGSIVYKVIDLNLYFGVELSGLKQGIDDIWDEVIRTQIVFIPLLDDNTQQPPILGVLKMHATLAQKARTVLAGQAGMRWGIEIVRVVVAAITPDQKMTDDLELRTREERQREGQRIELRHFTDRVMELMAPPPAGAGLTREQAIEQVQLSIGSAAAKTIDAKSFTFDPATAAIIAAVLGRKP